jgi:signal transduction histidine kinase
LGALSFEYSDAEQAIWYYNQSIQMKMDILEDSFSAANSYRNLSDVYTEIEEYKQAFSLLNKAEKIFLDYDDYESLAMVSLSKADLYKQQRNFTKASNELIKADRLISKTERTDFKKQQLKLFSEVLKEKGQHKKALATYKEYEHLNDSLLNADTFWRVAEIEKKHQLQIKQKELELVEKDRDLSEAKVLQTTTENARLNRTIGFVGFTAFLLVILVFYLDKLRKVTLQNSQQKEALLQERIHNLATDQEMKIMHATLKGRTKEKQNISKELHDNVGSLLTAMNFHLNAFNKSLFQSQPKMMGLYKKVLGITENVIDEVRHISHRLDHESSLPFNLEASVNEFCQKVENDQLKIETSVKNLDSFQNAELSIFIFRILQELVNNVIKHAEANSIYLSLVREQQGIQIQLKDNGKGFSKNTKKGIGLKNLQEQIFGKKGTISLETIPNQGTAVSIQIPT